MRIIEKLNYKGRTMLLNNNLIFGMELEGHLTSRFIDRSSPDFLRTRRERASYMAKKLVEFGIDYVFVNDQENSVLYQFDPKDHPASKLARECDSIELVSSKKAKSSRKVIFIKDGVKYDYGIRLRVTSNNGINAFLGLSKSNKNSQIVLKLQQDAVHKLVKDHIECETISYA